MSQVWSKSWVSSKDSSKQRKYRYNAPLHIKSKFLRVTLSEKLRKEYKKRNIRVKVGDIVKVMRGDFKGKTGTVTKVDVKKGKVFSDKIVRRKANGEEVLVPLEPSNLMIIELDVSDSRRFKKK